jgi:hypothetical protein
VISSYKAYNVSDTQALETVSGHTTGSAGQLNTAKNLGESLNDFVVDMMNLASVYIQQQHLQGNCNRMTRNVICNTVNK